MEQLIEIVKDGIENTRDILVAPCRYTLYNECTGIWASDQYCNITIQSVGNRVTLTLDRVIATADTASNISFVTFLDAEIRPNKDHYSSIHVTDNSVIKHGTLLVKTTGQILIYAGLNSGVFAGTGNSGFESSSVTYVT